MHGVFQLERRRMATGYVFLSLYYYPRVWDYVQGYAGCFSSSREAHMARLIKMYICIFVITIREFGLQGKRGLCSTICKE